MDPLTLDISALEEKDDQQMITLVDTSQLEEGDCELVDNSAPLVHHVLEPGEKSYMSNESGHCLVCNAKFGVSGRGAIHLFSGEVKSSRHMDIVMVLSSIIEKELDLSNTHSTILCKKCYKLIDDIDSIEGQLITMKQDINRKYSRTEAMVQLERNGINNLLKEEILATECHISEDDKEFKITSKIRGRKRKRGRARGRPPAIVKVEVKEEDSYDEFSLDFIEASHNDHESIQAVGEPEGITEMSMLETDKTAENVMIELDNVIDVDGLDLNNDGNTLQIGGMFFPTISAEEASKEPLSSQSTDDDLLNNATGKYRCRFCQVRLEAFLDMQNHLIQFHMERLFECEVCEQRLGSQAQLLEHLEHHLVSGEKPFPCRLCPRRYALPRQLKEHLRHHLSKTIPCYQCPKRFRSEGALQEHMNTHTGYRPYTCEQCHKKFTSKYILKTHMRTHSARNRPHKCKVCQKHFLTAHHLADHLQIHQNRKDYVCENCGKAFSTQRSLDLHSITHSGIKNFVCRTCFKAFARKGEVEDHERIHTGEKPFQCEICGATFSQRSNLQSHKRAIHYEEKKYQCKECTKAFKRRRLLVYHVMSVHTGERPYKCGYCNAAFVYPEHYKKHLRIHTGEKPFKCEICGKAFNSRDNKNAHKFIHSEKKQYECLLCGVGFMRKPQLLAHIMQHDRTENLESYVKMNSSSIVDAEVVEARGVSSPALGLKGDEETIESNLEDHIQLVRAATSTSDGETVEVLQRPIQIVDSDDVPRYIIHRAGEKTDDAVGHFLASLQGPVVEVRADDLERYTELTADQLSQMAQVAAQVVATQSTGTGGGQLQEDSADFRLFQIQLDEEKDQNDCQATNALLTSSEPTLATRAMSVQAKDVLASRQNEGILKKITHAPQVGTHRHIRTWHQSNDDFGSGS